MRITLARLGVVCTVLAVVPGTGWAQEDSDRDGHRHKPPVAADKSLPVWVGVDPTNRQLTGERHVKIGHGRHYSDVPPVKGVYRGAAGSHLEASVRMQRTDTVRA